MGGHAARLPKYFPLTPQACRGAGDRQKQVWQRLTPQVGNEQMGNGEAPHSPCHSAVKKNETTANCRKPMDWLSSNATALWLRVKTTEAIVARSTPKDWHPKKAIAKPRNSIHAFLMNHHLTFKMLPFLGFFTDQSVTKTLYTIRRQEDGPKKTKGKAIFILFYAALWDASDCAIFGIHLFHPKNTCCK